MAHLVLHTDEGQQVVELCQTNTLGRHPSNTIQLLDKIVSKEHCVIEQRGANFWLRDLGSLNGTYVNKQRVEKKGVCELKHGDVIALGQTKARFESGAPAPQPIPPSVAIPSQQQWAQQAAHPAGWPPQSGTAVASMPQPGQAGFAHQPPASQYAQQGHVARPPGPPPPRGQQRSTPPSGRRPPPPMLMRTPSRGFSTAYLPAITTGTHVDTDEEARQIGAEIDVIEHRFRPFHEVQNNMNLVQADYERLRFSYELTRDIADETDTEALLKKILDTIFRFIPAERGVIFLYIDGKRVPLVQHRTDGRKDRITVSETIINKVVEDQKAVLTHDAAMDFAASKGKSMILNQIQSAIVAPMSHNEQLLGVLWLDSKSLAQFQPKDLEMIGAVANQAAMFIEINLLSQQRAKLSRMMSPNVAERIIEGGVDIQPGGQRTEVSVFNSDIRGFTRMSEHTPAEELVEMLNAYFEEMVTSIFKHQGTLDKFMGDGIMALWGAPVSNPDDPERAVACALEQVEVLGRFNRARLDKDKPALGVGFGIHTGDVVAGYIGSKETLSYTVIGDVANISARICAKALAGQILVSSQTRDKLGAKFELEELAPIRIRGKDTPVAIWNVVRQRPSSQVPSSQKVADHPTDPSAQAIPATE